MALTKFRAPALPDPPVEWDRIYMRQLVRIIEIYFSQLDGASPNYAESYTAQFFAGLLLTRRVTTAERRAIPIVPDMHDRDSTVGMLLYDTDLNKLCFLTPAGWEAVTSVPSP